MKKKRIIVIGFALLAVVILVLALTGIIEESWGVCLALAMTVIFTIIVAIMAYKSEIKILTVLMSIFMVIGLVLLGFNVYNIFQKSEMDREKFKFKVVEDDSPKMSVFSYNNHTYYTYHLNKIDVTTEKGNTYPLKEALEGGHITLEDILSLAIPNDGTSGYKIYYDGGSLGKDDKYSIVVCENNNDIIFANYDYKYDASICSSDAS